MTPLIIRDQALFTTDFGKDVSSFHTILQYHEANFVHVYTDASKKYAATGAAFVINDCLDYNEGGITCENIDIVQAESAAILAALQVIATSHRLSQRRDVVIFTDSQQALRAIGSAYEGRGWVKPAILDIMNLFQLLFAEGRRIVLQFIPAHSGVEPHDRADHLAKLARNCDRRAFGGEKYLHKTLHLTAMKQFKRKKLDLRPIRPLLTGLRRKVTTFRLLPELLRKVASSRKIRQKKEKIYTSKFWDRVAADEVKKKLFEDDCDDQEGTEDDGSEQSSQEKDVAETETRKKLEEKHDNKRRSRVIRNDEHKRRGNLIQRLKSGFHNRSSHARRYARPVVGIRRPGSGTTYRRGEYNGVAYRSFNHQQRGSYMRRQYAGYSYFTGPDGGGYGGEK